MRDGWVEAAFGEVFKIVAGKYVAKDEYVEDGAFWIYGSNSIMGKLDKYLVEQSHVVMAAIGAYAGAVRYSEEPSWINNNAMALVPSDRVMAKYLHLWLGSKFDLKRVVVGTGQPYVQRPLLLKEIIELPRLPEQKRIVDLISSVDCYIEALQQQLEHSKRSRNAVLHELLSTGGDEWVEHKLIDMFEIYQPQTIAKSLMSEDGEFIVFGANGPIGRYHEFNHEEPEVVVTCRGATCGTVNMTPHKTWITGNAMVVSPKTSKVSKEFLYWALVAGVDIQSVISGSAQPQITREGLAPVKISIPPLSRQVEIVDLIGGFELNISQLDESLNKAKTLRSGLLSDLLSGEHEIPASYDKVMGAA
jgi:type I restriction enzyme S subunit